MDHVATFLSVTSILLSLGVLWRYRHVHRKADKALHIATGLRGRIIGVHKTMDKVTGEVQRMTGEQVSVTLEGEDASEWDDDLEDTKVKKAPAKKKRRRK